MRTRKGMGGVVHRAGTQTSFKFPSKQIQELTGGMEL